jgi:hypothetical protein
MRKPFTDAGSNDAASIGTDAESVPVLPRGFETVLHLHLTDLLVQLRRDVIVKVRERRRGGTKEYGCAQYCATWWVV